MGYIEKAGRERTFSGFGVILWLTLSLLGLKVVFCCAILGLCQTADIILLMLSKQKKKNKYFCHSPTQPQLELELDLIMGRNPPTAQTT